MICRRLSLGDFVYVLIQSPSLEINNHYNPYKNSIVPNATKQKPFITELGLSEVWLAQMA